MIAIPARPSVDACPVCGAARAVAMRSHAAYCSARCRKVANKEKKRLLKQRAARRPHAKVPAGTVMSTIALRAAFGVDEPFTLAQARVAAGRSGAHLARNPLAKLLSELVQDGLLEKSVAPSGAWTFRFPLIRRRPLSNKSQASGAVRDGAPKRGVQAGASDGGTVSSPVVDHVLQVPSAPPQAAQGQGREAAAPCTPDPSVKMIAPPTIDGGTAFTLKAEASSWNEQLRDLVSTAAGKGWKLMPKTIPLHDDDGVLICTAKVRRSTHGGVSLEFEGAAQLDLYDKAGHAVLITKASTLWVDGVEAWMRTWFDLASWLLLGVRCASPADAASLGWKTRNLELCADFTGLRFFHADVPCFMGGGPDGAGCFQSKGYKGDGSVETIESGRRRRNGLSVGTHNKTQKVVSDKSLPEKSVYSSTWRAFEWDGKSEIRRVEVRADGDSLKLTDDEQKLDLQPPHALLDEAMLRLFWQHATHRVCLALPPKAGGALNRHQVDPRWKAVQAAGGTGPAPRFVVDRSEARRLDLVDLRERANRDVLRALARAVGLHAADDVDAAIASVVGAATGTPDFAGLVEASRDNRDRRIDGAMGAR